MKGRYVLIACGFFEVADLEEEVPNRTIPVVSKLDPCCCVERHHEPREEGSPRLHDTIRDDAPRGAKRSAEELAKRHFDAGFCFTVPEDPNDEVPKRTTLPEQWKRQPQSDNPPGALELGENGGRAWLQMDRLAHAAER
jgi:hypothetical protein